MQRLSNAVVPNFFASATLFSIRQNVIFPISRLSDSKDAFQIIRLLCSETPFAIEEYLFHDLLLRSFVSGVL